MASKAKKEMRTAQAHSTGQRHLWPQQGTNPGLVYISARLIRRAILANIGQLRSHQIQWQQQCHILYISCKFLQMQVNLCGICDSKCLESVNAAPRPRRGEEIIV